MTKIEVLSAPRPENLAFVFQEVLTAIVRLRTNRQTVSDSALFRAQIKDALTVSEKEAAKLGYSPETVRLAKFAVVASLDESVLNQQAPTFADWARQPLQQDLLDRKSTRLNSSHGYISYAVFCLKKKTHHHIANPVRQRRRPRRRQPHHQT